jgi:hypothetical protein
MATREIQNITAAAHRAHPLHDSPVLHVEFDGRQADIWYEQKLLAHGLVYLGTDFYDFEAILPADPANGRLHPQTVRGFTNDVRILRLTKQYLQALDDNSWKPGPLKI